MLYKHYLFIASTNVRVLINSKNSHPQYPFHIGSNTFPKNVLLTRTSASVWFFRITGAFCMYFQGHNCRCTVDCIGSSWVTGTIFIRNILSYLDFFNKACNFFTGSWKIVFDDLQATKNRIESLQLDKAVSIILELLKMVSSSSRGCVPLIFKIKLCLPSSLPLRFVWAYILLCREGFLFLPCNN